jgi:hypothetical protein
MVERGRREGGGVLALVLLFVLGLELLAHGALLMARQEAAASRAGSSLLQARLAAAAGLRSAQLPAGTVLATVPLQGEVAGVHGPVGEGRYRVLLRRLGRERWLLRSEGWVEHAGGVVRRGALAWLPDPVERLRAFGGVVVVDAAAPVVVAGTVETSGVRRDGPDLAAAPCGPWLAELDSLFAGRSVAAVATAEMDRAVEPSLGLLGRDDLVAWIGGAAVAGTGAVAVPGSLRLDGVEGEGLLVVSGDLEMVGGRHEGVVLVGGTLTLREGAILVGFARAAGGLVVGADARITGSGCRALIALAGGLEQWIRPLLPAAGTFPLY